MNTNKLLLRLIISPFMLPIMLITVIYNGIRTWLLFIWYGGEFLIGEKDERKTAGDIYNMLKEILKEKEVVK